MKHIILALAIATPTAYANEQCSTVGSMAAKIMEARQAGVPMSRVMEISKDSKLMQRMAVDAYERPRFSTEQYKNSAVTDFQSEWELACFKATKERT